MGSWLNWGSNPLAAERLRVQIPLDPPFCTGSSATVEITNSSGVMVKETAK